MQHCWKPDKSIYLATEDKDKVMDTLYHQDKKLRGLDDFAQHLLVSPDGLIWLNRDINKPPYSIKGRNGNDKFGPMVVAILGNFDKDKEKIEQEQLSATTNLLKFLFDFHVIPEEKFIFHSEHSPRTSPGSSLNKNQLLLMVRECQGYGTKQPLCDIEEHPYNSYIKEAVKDGFINIYPDGMFHPNAPITRGELASFYSLLKKNVRIRVQ